MNKIVIWDSEVVPSEDKKGICVLWSLYCKTNHPNRISIPNLVEVNSVILREKYLDWIFNVGEELIDRTSIKEHLLIRPKLSYWWMTKLVKKSNWGESQQITNAIKLFAFFNWIESVKSDSIVLHTYNKNLARCFEVWCREQKLSFTWKVCKLKQKDSDYHIKRVLGSLPYGVYALAWFIKYVFDSLPLVGVGVKEWKESSAETTFISYLFDIDRESIKNREFTSPYWTSLPEAFAKKNKQTNWLHHYIKDSVFPKASDAAKYLFTLNSNKNQGQVHTTLISFLNFSVIYRTLKDWIKLRRLSLKLENRISKMSVSKLVWPLYEEEWKKSMFGEKALSNLLMLNLFEVAFKKLPIQKKGVYLQENQEWEFALITAWKEARHNFLVGYPHAAIRFWELGYFFDPRTYRRDNYFDMPLPNKIACNGKYMFEAYRTGGYPKQDLVKVEALRYLYLDKYHPINKHNSHKASSNLLVLGDFSGANTERQLNLLYNAKLFIESKINITFKPHPACSLDYSKFSKLKMKIERKDLNILVREYDRVYTSANTSAVVDAYSSGVSVASLLDGKSLNLSPLRGFKEVEFITTPEDLANWLDQQYLLKVEKTKRTRYFYLDINLPLWTKLII